MRRFTGTLAVTGLAVLTGTATIGAQVAAPATTAAKTSTAETEVRAAERAYVDAAHDGRSVRGMLADDYFDIIPPGTTRTVADFAEQPDPRPRAYDAPDLKVNVVGNVAIVTGTVGGPSDPARRDRILRVWAKQGRTWRAVGYHGTWVGDRSATAQPPLPVPASPVHTFQPTTDSEKAIWAVHQGIERASANSDAEAYRRLTTRDFTRVTEAGEARTLDEWVAGFNGTKRRESAQDDVRIRVLGDVALMTYRNFASDPQGAQRPMSLMTRLFQKQGSDWKLLYTQGTVARRPAPVTTR